MASAFGQVSGLDDSVDGASAFPISFREDSEMLGRPEVDTGPKLTLSALFSNSTSI